jgi:hypothetical protein
MNDKKTVARSCIHSFNETLALKMSQQLLLTLCCNSVFAGAMGSVCVSNATVPCIENMWNFGIQALYIQPVFGGDLAALGATTDIGLNTTTIERKLRWGVGYMLEGSYHFRASNDATLNWYHFSEKSKQINTISYVFNDFSPTIDVLNNAENRTQPKWDAVNFELAQHVDFGKFTSLRLHAGVQYARINTSEIETDFLMFLPDLFSDISGVTINRTMNGFGPRLGLDTSYTLAHAFSIESKVAAAILVGLGKYHATVSDMYSSPISSTIIHNYSASRTAIVPELELKLGANYTYAAASGNLIFNAGYMWINYFNAQQSYAIGTQSDFSLNGIYAGLIWAGNFM